MVLCHASQFEVHMLPDWQPMELLQNWRNVLMSSPVIRRTVAFWTACTRRNKLLVMPYRSELQ